MVDRKAGLIPGRKGSSSLFTGADPKGISVVHTLEAQLLAPEWYGSESKLSTRMKTYRSF
jgi:hypothetical protein